MTRKVLRELDELIKEEPNREQIRYDDIDRLKRKRYKQEIYRNVIHNYLRKYKKPISMLSKEDIVIMTEGLDNMDKTLFMDQVKHCLEVNYGKPISWIAKNKKSILFTNNK